MRMYSRERLDDTIVHLTQAASRPRSLAVECEPLSVGRAGKSKATLKCYETALRSLVQSRVLLDRVQRPDDVCLRPDQRRQVQQRLPSGIALASHTRVLGHRFMSSGHLGCAP